MVTKEYRRAYYQAHKNEFAKYRKDWRMKNPEQYRAQQNRQRAKNLEIYNRLKCKPCVDCKQQYNPWIMQWDHLGNKTFTISESGHCMSKRVLAEIKKCDLVCANCHADRTHKRRVLCKTQNH